VTVDGRAVKAGSVQDGLSAGLALAPEERKSQGLVLDWELDKNVTLPSLKRFTVRGYLRPGRERSAAHTQLRRLNTKPDDPSAQVRTLSGGNQQKVVLARWLLHGSKVMLLDEPTRGIDVEARSEIYRQVRDFTNAGGGALVVSSDSAELVGLCDRVVVIREGRVAGEVSGATLTEHDVLTLALGAVQPDVVNVVAEALPAEAPAAAPKKAVKKAAAKKAPAKRTTPTRNTT
jgi:ribose transport system ATP-binding protein